MNFSVVSIMAVCFREFDLIILISSFSTAKESRNCPASVVYLPFLEETTYMYVSYLQLMV